MITPRDPDAILGAWLDENRIPLPTETRRAIEVGVRATPQRRYRRWLPQLSMAIGAVVLAIAFVDELVLELRGRRVVPVSEEATRNE